LSSCNSGNVPDVIVLTETWVGSQDKDFFNIENYTVLFSDDHSRRGKGTVLYIRNNFSFSIIEDIKITNCDIVAVNIVLGKRHINLVGIYRNHASDIDSFAHQFEKLILGLSRNNRNTIITGDLNIDMAVDNSIRDKYINSYEIYGFKQLIVTPTRISNTTETIIDHVVTNADFDVSCSTEDWSISDHRLIRIQLKSPTDSDDKYDNAQYFDFKRYDKRRFTDGIRDTNWLGLMTDDLDASYSAFANKFLEITEKNNLIKNVPMKNKKRKNWVTVGILTSIKKREALYKKSIKNPSNLKLKEDYKRYAKRLKIICYRAKKLFYSNLINNSAGDSKKTWHAVNNLLGRSSKCQRRAPNAIYNNDALITDSKNIGDVMCRHFSGQAVSYSNVTKSQVYKASNNVVRNCHNMFINPVSEREIINNIKLINTNTRPGIDKIHGRLVEDSIEYIAPFLEVFYNRMISDAQVPKSLKRAIIVPVYKGGTVTDKGNYRPITIISIILKCYERLIYNRVSSFVNKHNLISKCQFGFTPGSSTEDAIVSTVDFLQKSLNSKNKTLAIFIDLQKAFDSIRHDILKQKLKRMGISGLANDILLACLSNREICVDVNGTLSDKLPQNYGIPQGSVLGPLLFNLAINDIVSITDNCKGCHINLYADDMVLLFSAKTVILVQNFIDIICSKLSAWLNCNFLLINAQKTQYIIFDIKTMDLFDYNVIIQNKVIVRTNDYKYLGIVIDCNLKFNKHIKSITNRIRPIVAALYRINWFLDINHLRSVYYALVHSILSYGIVVWGSTYNSHLKQLNSIQRKVIRIIYKKCRRESVADLMIGSKIMSIQEIFDYKSCILGFKIYKESDKYSLHLKKIINITKGSCLPVYHEVFYLKTVFSEFAKRSLRYSIPSNFNKLHHSVRNTDNIHIFKKRLKLFVFFKGSPLNFRLN